MATLDISVLRKLFSCGILLWLFLSPQSVFGLATVSAGGKKEDINMPNFDQNQYGRSGVKHNFAQGSPFDETLYISERPGNPENKGDLIPIKKFNDWSIFMKEHGISHIINLLDDNEMANYPYPGLMTLFEDSGFVAYRQGMREPNAALHILGWIDQCHERNEKVVVHCTGGIGRAGRVAAAWLVYKHGLSAEEATGAVLQNAKLTNVKRKGDVESLKKWLGVS